MADRKPAKVDDQWETISAPNAESDWETVSGPQAPRVGTPEFKQSLATARNRLNQQNQPGFQFSDSYDDQNGSALGRAAQGAWDAVKQIPAGVVGVGKLLSENAMYPSPQVPRPATQALIEHSIDRAQEAKKAWQSGDKSTLGETAKTALIAGQRSAEAVPMIGGVGEGIAQNMATGNEAGGLGNGIANLAMLDASTPGTMANKAAGGLGRAIAKAPGRALGSMTDAAVRKLGGGADRMGTTPVGGPVASSATRGAVADYASQIGADLLPGQATESRPLRGIQSAGERSLTHGEPVQNHIESQHRAISNAVDDFKTRVAGDTPVGTTEDVGSGLQQGTKAAMDKLKASAQADYQAFSDANKGVTVDTSDIGPKYRTRLQQMDSALSNLPAQYAKPIRALLEKASQIGTDQTVVNIGGRKVPASSLPEGVRRQLGLPEAGTASMDDVQQLRSAYLDLSRDFSGNVPKRVNAIAKDLAQDLDSAMAKAADKSGTSNQWRQANAKWKQMHEDFNDSSSPLYRVLQGSDPTKIPESIIGQGQTGGSPQAVRMLKAHDIDLGPLKAEVAERVAQRGFSSTRGGNRFGGYSHDFLTELFSPAELDELYKLGRVGRAVGFERNPSGTSDVMGATRQIGEVTRNPVRAAVGVLPESLAARFTMSPRVRAAALGRSSLPSPPGPQVLPPEASPSSLGRTAGLLEAPGPDSGARMTADYGPAPIPGDLPSRIAPKGLLGPARRVNPRAQEWLGKSSTPAPTATPAAAAIPREWNPPVDWFKKQGENYRFENPNTGGVETWMLWKGKPIRIAPQAGASDLGRGSRAN